MLVIVIILVLSFAKFPSFNYLPKTISWDKLVHICMYFALAFILLYDYSRSKGEKNSKWMPVLICVFFPVVFGGMIEVLQPILSRSAEWLDWLSDITGVLLGWGIFLIFKRKFIT